jgi:inosine-uridine nucleoside N-ribohydrolase
MGDRLMIDTDPATGYRFRDVDDGLALLYLLARPDVEVVGVSTVFGNVSSSKATAKAYEVLEVAGRPDVPVYAGASGARDRGDTHASDALRKAAMEEPGTLTVLAIGPLANVFAAGRDPGFYPSLKKLVVMGGVLVSKGRRHGREFNFFRDSKAARAVVGAPCSKAVITQDLCKQVVFTSRELERLSSIDSSQARYLARHIKPWLRFNKAVGPFVSWKGGFVPWDVVAAVYLFRPDLFKDVYDGPVDMPETRIPTGEIELGGAGPAVEVPLKLADGQGLLDEFLDIVARYSDTGSGLES